MRLLHSKTRQLKEFMGDDNLPDYAIVSHTWGDDEVTYQDLQQVFNVQVKRKAGYKKIKYSCEQAANDKLDWVWIDT